jgi:CHAT domain-containing protein
MRIILLIITVIQLSMPSALAQDFMTLNDQFIALFQQGKYKEAIQIGIKALQQCNQEFGNKHINYAIAADNLANAYFNSGQFSQALTFTHLARHTYIIVTGKKELLEVGICDNRLGAIFSNSNRNDSAIYYYDAAFGLFIQYPEEQYDNLLQVSKNYCATLSTVGSDNGIETICNLVIPGIKKKKGVNSADFIDMMALKGEAQRAQQKMREAVPTYDTLLQSAEVFAGKQSALYALMLDGRGDCLRAIYQFEAAEKDLIAAMHIRKQITPVDSMGMAANHHYRANLYAAQADFARAEMQYDSSLQLYQLTGHANDDYYSTVLRSKAYTYVEAGQHTKAKQTLRQVLKLQSERYGNDHFLNGEVLITLANSEFQTGELAASQKNLDRGEKIVRQQFGDSSYLIARCFEIRGLLLHKIGKSEEGLRLCKTALALNDRIFGVPNEFSASALSNMGLIATETGDYANAEEYQRKAFSLRKELYGLDHSMVALSMTNLAVLMIYQSRFEDADKLLAAAYEIEARKGLLTTPVGLTTFNNIAMLLQKQGDYAKADQFYQKIIELLKTDSVQNKVVYGLVLNNLSTNAIDQKQYEASLNYATRAMEAISKMDGTASQAFLRAANNQMVAYMRLRQFDNARKAGLQLALEIKKSYGDSAALLETVYSNLSSLEAQSGNLPLAVQYLQQSLQLQMSNYEKNIYALSERDQVAYWQQQSYTFQLFPALLLAMKNPDAEWISNMVNQQLRLKGFVLNNASATMQKARQLKDEKLQILIDEWQSTRSLYLQQSALPFDDRMYSPDSLSTMANNIEQVINKMAGKALFAQTSAITWQRVQQSLESDETAVEFIRFPLFENNRYTDSIFYAAIVIPQKGMPSLIKLGDEKTVEWCMTAGKTDSKEVALAQLYRSSIKPKNNYGPAFTGDSLYRIIFQPLLPYLMQTKKISYAPDGLLHKIAFAALPIGNGTILLDSFQIQQFSSVRLIANRNINAVNWKTAVLAGFADFGSSGQSANAWSPLPGTEKELQTLQSLFQSRQVKSTVFSANNATEENLKKLSNNAPAILHIATHGFFLPDPPMNNTTGSLQSPGMNQPAPDQNPLMRSGIVLAGANRYWKNTQVAVGKDDGIVTAYELAQLNLQGAEMAVLSACETGLGEVQDAEGVFGLQRALKMAGIKYMLLSLWEVPDNETMELMSLFYTKLLSGTAPRNAFDQAQRAMRSKYPPFAWAAFVLME